MKRILFVDDETSVLEGIRTMLRKRRKEWDMQFVGSGAGAIAILESRPMDLVCSDMRMPGMDGAQLLTLVSERWPSIARIVLSGYSELVQETKSLSVAHQILSKPCDPDKLQSAIEQCLSNNETNPNS